MVIHCNIHYNNTLQYIYHHNYHSVLVITSCADFYRAGWPQPIARTVGFHNFNLRIFNLRVSNPNKSIVDVFVDTMSDFNVPGSRPKKTR